MKRILHSFVRPVLRRLGLDLIKYSFFPRDFDALSIRICESVKNYTMTSAERINALVEAVKYIIKSNIDGAFVECGVWKGGSVMAIALMLREMKQEREIYLYDTFSGMCAPLPVDGGEAQRLFLKTKTSQDSSNWLQSPIEEVERNVFATGYPKDRFHFIKGKVEDTLPEQMPQRIALLRLDTDFYESTKHALFHLFPLVSPKGVVIIDDYGLWPGAKKAVDEYISQNRISILLNRIDSQGRIAIKNP